MHLTEMDFSAEPESIQVDTINQGERSPSELLEKEKAEFIIRIKKVKENFRASTEKSNTALLKSRATRVESLALKDKLGGLV